LVRRLIVNDGKTEASRTFEIEEAIINENAFFGCPLSDGKRDAENAFFGLARMDVTGTEKNLKTLAKVEGFDAVLIQLKRLVVDRSDEVAAGLHAGLEDGAGSGIFPGLCKHEGGEFLAGKFSRPVEERSIEIFVDGNLSGIEGREAEIVAVLKVLPIKIEGVGGFLTGSAIPAVGENHAADIPEEGGDARHGHNSFPRGWRRRPGGFYCN